MLQKFSSVENLSTGSHIRFTAAISGRTLKFLLVKQSTMGKTGCQDAVNECLDDFDCGALFCVGIAGSLSRDVAIGDVCYSKTICDVVENSKVTDAASSGQNLHLSPEWYHSPPELIIPINLDRIDPHTKAGHVDWVNELETLGKRLIPGEFTGREGKETIQRPKVHEGAIACGFVSGSSSYNDKIRAIDRKVLAIETESGGLFSVARRRGDLPAITIRGISDYAGTDKNRFEVETNNKAREFAIATASSFLVRQLSSAAMFSYFDRRRLRRANDEAQLPLDQTVEDSPASVLVRQDEDFDLRLRELAPGYALVPKGYRIAVPRIRVVDTRSGAPNTRGGEPIDVREALRDARVITLHIPREYPDLSLSWTIAKDLLSAQLGETQVVPSVIEASG